MKKFFTSGVFSILVVIYSLHSREIEVLNNSERGEINSTIFSIASKNTEEFQQHLIARDFLEKEEIWKKYLNHIQKAQESLQQLKETLDRKKRQAGSPETLH